MTHLEHLLRSVPDLAERRILDIGSGRGAFLVEAAKRGFKAEGLEYNPAYIALTKERAAEAKVSVVVKEGKGEHLPFADASFDFINVCEVLEHVTDPEQVVREVSRVLSQAGVAYVSIPNRFGFLDPHFHVYGVNWLPRAWSKWYLTLVGAEKNEGHDAGHQELSEMHYLTRVDFARLLLRHNLRFEDSRETRLKRMPLGFLLVALYRAFSTLFISTFHGFARPVR